MFKKIFLFLIVTTFFLFAQVNDPYFQYQWNLTKISAPSAWGISTGSPSIKIAIIDQGVQSDHPDLLNKVTTGYDIENNDYSTEPDPSLAISWHGTACAGVAAATANNNTGIAGIAYNCTIIPIQVSHDRYWNANNIAAAINIAATLDADVISMSGTCEVNQNVINAVNNVTQNGRDGKGCVVIMSAGDTGIRDGELHNVQFPAYLSNVLSVGATDQNDNRINESSYSNALDVVAPSVIYACDLTGTNGLKSGDYMDDFNGTSSSAPEVAGLAALILSLNNNFTESEVRTIICSTADDINTSGYDEKTGWGRINCWRALDEINHTTTNGELPRDEIWFGTINLTGNVTIPDEVKLTILSSATINLNGFSIVSTGGTIIDEGATINGARATLCVATGEKLPI